jgi:hypothetical protein
VCVYVCVLTWWNDDSGGDNSDQPSQSCKMAEWMSGAGLNVGNVGFSTLYIHPYLQNYTCVLYFDIIHGTPTQWWSTQIPCRVFCVCVCVCICIFVCILCPCCMRCLIVCWFGPVPEHGHTQPFNQSSQSGQLREHYCVVGGKGFMRSAELLVPPLHVNVHGVLTCCVFEIQMLYHLRYNSLTLGGFIFTIMLLHIYTICVCSPVSGPDM